MKYGLLGIVIAVGSLGFADGEKYVDPNPYALYAAATQRVKGWPTAVELNEKSAKEIAAATDDSALAGFVKDAASAAALLGQIRPNYATECIAAYQIGAVSQYVMRVPAGRKTWTQALLTAARAAKDTYVKEYCLDQLMWCGFPEQAKDVLAIGKDSGCAAVQDLAEMVARELTGRDVAHRDDGMLGDWAIMANQDRMPAGYINVLKDGSGNPYADVLWSASSAGRTWEKGDYVVKGDRFKFVTVKYFPKDKPKSEWHCRVLEGRRVGNFLYGYFHLEDGFGKQKGDKIAFSGRRVPPIGPKPDLAAAVRGKPINLLKDAVLTNDFVFMEWDQAVGRDNGWSLKDGVLSNRVKRKPNGDIMCCNGSLRTRRTDFMDFNMTFEARILPKCNSGVYLRGLYEIQLIDSGEKLSPYTTGACYGRIAPSVLASKPANEWQTFDVTLYKRHLTVVLNGKKIIDNEPIRGVTGSAITSDEFKPGPMYFQGDHSDADFRNIVITPLAEPPPDRLRPSGTNYAEQELKDYVEKGVVPGAISVFIRDDVQESSCMGYADREAKRPIAMDDVFMQCSQTKGFCGVTVAMLLEEGKIALDDPISKYLPEFKEMWVVGPEKDGVKALRRAKTPITIRMAMTHMAGFDFEVPAREHTIPGGGWTGGMPIRSVVAEAAGRPLLFEPGAGIKYSNLGIDVGAAIVETVTGKKWEQFLKERVLDPLEMKDSWFWPTDEQLKHKVEFYGCSKDGPAGRMAINYWIHTPYNDSHVFAASASGLWTTANDQLKFYKMLMNLGRGENGVRILQEDTVRKYLATSLRPAGREGYSLGLSAPADGADENAWFGHGGAWGTNCSVNWHKRWLKLWVVQIQGGPRPFDKAWDKAADRFFGAEDAASGVKAYTGRVK